MYLSSVFSLEKIISMATKMNKTPKIVLVKFVLINLKYGDFPKISSLSFASTLV
jgi:hypothetical protein